MSTEFVVPPLQPGDWRPVCKAAFTPLLAKENGQALYIGLLPGYVNRRTAECELVVDAIKKTTLDEASELLCTLDDPIDAYQAMQQLCRRDWFHGIHIDDFFYELKKLAKDANADNNLICNIMIGQLPKSIQQKVKETYSDKKGDAIISDANARAVLARVKELLNERGIPLNTGCQKLDEIDNHSKIKSVVNCTAPNEKDQTTEDCIGRISHDYNSRDYNNRDYNSSDYNNRDYNSRDSNSRDITEGKDHIHKESSNSKILDLLFQIVIKWSKLCG